MVVQFLCLVSSPPPRLARHSDTSYMSVIRPARHAVDVGRCPLLFRDLFMTDDRERNRFAARAGRYARVGVNVGGVAARMAGAKLFGVDISDRSNAALLTEALGGLKGPLMKVAQLVATIPDVLPPEYAEELQKLQSDAPPMGAAFVKRRMMAELGPDWQQRFRSFDLKPSAAASLGQVHKAVAHDGAALACKLQYPDMQSAVEADLKQLEILFSLHRRMDPAIDTTEILKEIAARVREELDYRREAQHAALYALMLANEPMVRVPDIWPDLSTGRLLTLSWLEGRKILAYKEHDLETRNRLATAMFRAWWVPFSQYGVIHGDPHLGNYTVFEEEGRADGINLLDYGCIRIFPPRFVGGVVDLYRGLLEGDDARVVHAYETWGFKGLKKDLIEVLNVWARFIYGPLLDDRVRSIADGVSPAQYGRREAFQVHRALKEKGPVTVPQEFVFMDRAAIGLGGVFLHLKAELNFHQLFESAMHDFSIETVTRRQSDALSEVGLGRAAA
jgi:predicted unusual protein kinase regulating ubiquinone biosynthesis (AarF/ABC1/UbiB family)